MANQQLKRLLRRGPQMEEAEFELLQSRVLSRLNRTVPDPADDAPAQEAAPEPDQEVAPEPDATEPTSLAIDTGPSTNGTHADPPTEPRPTDSRIRSIKVTTYDLPAPAVPVMADPPPVPDWDLAALPMIIDSPRRKVATITRSILRNGTRPTESSATRQVPVKRTDVEPLDTTMSSAILADAPVPSVDEDRPIDGGTATDLPGVELDTDGPAEAAAVVETPVTPDETAAEPELAIEWAVPATKTPRVRKAPTRPAARRAPRPRAVAAPIAPRDVVPAQSATVAAPYCPYCALRLDPPPTTSRRCTRCHERIVVKRVDGRVIYLTEASVAVFEAERLRMTNAGRWARERSRWLKVAATVGAPEGRIARLAAAPISAEVVAAAEALYTTTVERSFRSARQERRWEDASRVRREQAQVLFRFAGSPIPPPETIVRLHQEGAAAQLRGIEEMTRQAELVSAGCCDTCRADGGQTFKISPELRAPRLPHAGCPKGLCRCDWYLPVRDQTMVRRQLRRRARVDQTALSRSD